MPARALIVDDHPIIRDTLVTSLISLGVFDEIDTASSFRELTDQLDRDATYQLLILDLGLSDSSGSEGPVLLRERFPELPIIIFSANDAADTVAQCFEYGVHGFVPKNSSMQVFVQAIQLVLAGSMYIPPSAVRRMGFDPASNTDMRADAENHAIHLTPKQRAVFDQLLLGVPNKLIAKRLGMAEGTVKTHLYVIYQLLGVNSRAQAILKARQLSLE